MQEQPLKYSASIAEGEANPAVEKSIVSIVKCTTYQQETVNQAVDFCLTQLGGLGRFIKAGDHVHLKPNLLTAKSPDKAATTHPALVFAVAKMVKELGAKVTIGDSPAGITRPIEEYWESTGMRKVADQLGLSLVKFEKNDVVRRTVNGKDYYIAKIVAEADVVINLCKLKTHNLVLFTGAIKNMFGSIPGFRKSQYHKEAPRVAEFSEIIVDIFSLIKPQINIMDAVVIMEGNGPSAGNPKELGLILASTDAVALDSIAAGILGFEDGEIATTELAFERGLGEKRSEKIMVKGEKLADFSKLIFNLPSNRFLNYVPSSLVRWLGKFIWVRPEPIEDKCQRCGACIKNCPTKAMESQQGFPVIDYKKCISCFCCDEICPHDAINQKISWLAKKFS